MKSSNQHLSFFHIAILTIIALFLARHHVKICMLVPGRQLKIVGKKSKGKSSVCLAISTNNLAWSHHKDVSVKTSLNRECAVYSLNLSQKFARHEELASMQTT